MLRSRHTFLLLQNHFALQRIHHCHTLYLEAHGCVVDHTKVEAARFHRTCAAILRKRRNRYSKVADEALGPLSKAG